MTDKQTDTAKRGRGRPRNENYLPFEEAREVVRGELLPSRGKFEEWWKRNKPKAIPRFPYRSYQDKWISWNDFLGNNNKFSEKAGRSWRPLSEATTWVHSLKLKGYDEWMTWCKEPGNLPDDIPARPDIVYNKWISWNHWLGNKPVQALEAQLQAQKNAIYYIIREQHVPENVFTYGIEPQGISGIKQRWDREKFTPVKMFWYDSSKGNIIKQIVEAFSSPYMGDDRQRITPNVFELIWHMQIHLSTVTTKEINAYTTTKSPLKETSLDSQIE